jgi:hypothetical protein
MFGRINHYPILFVSLSVSALLLDMPSSQAEFVLNFKPVGSSDGGSRRSGFGDVTFGTCGDGSRSSGGFYSGSRFGSGGGGGLCMSQEIVSENGVDYYHILIGDPSTDDFAMDTYIRTASCQNADWNQCRDGSRPASSSDGNPSNLRNFSDPFDPSAGSGTGNPTRVYMRQINNGPGFQQEYLKAKMAYKPIITQSIVNGEYSDHMVIDMTNSTLGDMTTVGNVDLTVIVRDSSSPDNSVVSDFDLQRDADNLKISAGLWKYDAGSGPGGSSGTYTYAYDSFDVYSVDWYIYCDTSVSGNDCQRKSSGGGSGWGGGGSWGGGGW